MQRKKDQQLKMRAELDMLIEKRKAVETEKEQKINMVEFSMNKKSLKDLGIVDKQTLEHYYEKNSPSHINDGISMKLNIDSP